MQRSPRSRVENIAVFVNSCDRQQWKHQIVLGFIIVPGASSRCGSADSVTEDSSTALRSVLISVVGSRFEPLKVAISGVLRVPVNMRRDNANIAQNKIK